MRIIVMGDGQAVVALTPRAEMLTPESTMRSNRDGLIVESRSACLNQSLSSPISLIQSDRERLCGTLNGGVVNVLVEHPTYLALLTLLTETEFPMTSDVFIQHMRPLPGDAEYRLHSKVIRRGKSMAWVNTDVFANDVLVSTARITKTILPGKPAR